MWREKEGYQRCICLTRLVKTLFTGLRVRQVVMMSNPDSSNATARERGVPCRSDVAAS